MKSAENAPKTPHTGTGVFAALGGLLRLGGSGAPRIAPRGRLASVFALALGALALASSPALAAAPEAPTLTVEEPVPAAEASVHGLLNPAKEGEPGTYEVGTYQFLYRASKTKECKGGAAAPATPEISLGGGREAVSQVLSPLTAGTEYAVCLQVETAGGTSVSAPTTFTTARPPETPEVKPANPVAAQKATLNGVVNPKAKGDRGTYEFAYRPSAGTTQCTGEGEEITEPAGVSLGEEHEAVKAQVTGLLPMTTYAFCLRAHNAAREESALSAPETFTTPAAPPTIAEESAAGIGASEATLTAQIDAGGASTTYHVACVSDAQFVASGFAQAVDVPFPDAPLGAPRSAVAVDQRLGALQPATIYHCRFVASNALGTSEGAGVSFATSGSLGSATAVLPDNRAYEVVSPIENPGEINVPLGTDSRVEDTESREPFRASADGDATAYAGAPAASGGNGIEGNSGANEFLAERTASGWRAAPIFPPSMVGETSAETSVDRFEWFSSDLSIGILSARSRFVAAGAQPPGPQPACTTLYARSDSEGALHALFGSSESPGNCGNPFFAGASADGSHLIFQTEAALTAPATKTSGVEVEQGCQENCNLYDARAGKLQLVNVLPDGAVDQNATFGGSARKEGAESDFSNVISADGSRIFWTDVASGVVYVRENDTRTVQVSSGVQPAQFWTATPSGQYVFYSEGGALWRFNVDRFDESKLPEAQALADARELLAGESAAVRGVLGASEDGSYVYFVADGNLAGNENSQGEKATSADCEKEQSHLVGVLTAEFAGHVIPGKGCNLYVLHVGAVEPIRFIGTLAAIDNEVATIPSGSGNTPVGVWNPDLGLRTAEVTPDGKHLVFESTQHLTGYDNSALVKEEKAGIGHGLEVFVYTSDTNTIACASCSPTGAPPVSEHLAGRSQSESTGRGGGTYLQVSGTATYSPRWISTNGSRVFFDTSQPLVSQDSNRVQDVYEWESPAADGAGGDSCTPSDPRFSAADRGCVYLLSGGTSSDYAYFTDASESGDDVFFTSRSQLVTQDHNEKLDLYDARVDGGFPEMSLACTGTGCQGVPPGQPIFATPASVTFAGLGNFPESPPARGGARHRTAAQRRAQRRAEALRECRRERSKVKRERCEVSARRRYGPARKAAKSRKASNHRGAKR